MHINACSYLVMSVTSPPSLLFLTAFPHEVGFRPYNAPICQLLHEAWVLVSTISRFGRGSPCAMVFAHGVKLLNSAKWCLMPSYDLLECFFSEEVCRRRRGWFYGSTFVVMRRRCRRALLNKKNNSSKHALRINVGCEGNVENSNLMLLRVINVVSWACWWQ